METFLGFVRCGRAWVTFLLLPLMLFSLIWPTIALSSSDAPTPIDRDIMVNTVLTPDKSPYIITRNITIKAEVRIEKGVVVIFAPGVRISVNHGIIVAEGEPDAPIVFVNRGSIDIRDSILVLKNVVMRGGLVFHGVVSSSIRIVDSMVDGDIAVRGGACGLCHSTLVFDNTTIRGSLVLYSSGSGNTSIALLGSRFFILRSRVSGGVAVIAGSSGLSLNIPRSVNVTAGGASLNITRYVKNAATMFGALDSTISVNDSELGNFSIRVERSLASHGAGLFNSSLVIDHSLLRNIVVEGPSGIMYSLMRVNGSSAGSLYIHGYGLMGGALSGRGIDWARVYLEGSVFTSIDIRGESIADNWVHSDWGIYGSTSILSIKRCKMKSLSITGERGGVGGESRVVVLYSTFTGPKSVYVQSVVDSTVIISYSCLDRGTSYGLRLDSGYVYAGYNWWGSALGPALGSSVIGGSRIVLGRNAVVDYKPWLRSKPSWCIAGQPPVAIISVTPRHPYWGTNVTFYGTLSYDVDGRIVRYEWSFGDGSRGEGAIVSHVYEVPGSYSVTLTVVDNSGLSGSKTIILVVDKRPVRLSVSSIIASKNSVARLEARLYDDVTGYPVAGRELLFYLDGEPVGSAITNRQGVASINLDTSGLSLGRHKLVVRFPGDKFYNASNATAYVNIVSFRVEFKGFSTQPASVEPGAQAMVTLRLLYEGNEPIKSRIELDIFGKRFSVVKLLFPGENIVQVPVVVPADAASGNYTGRLLVYILDTLYMETNLYNLVSVKPIISVSIEDVKILDTPVVGKSFRVEVKLRNTGNCDAELRVSVSIEGLGSASSVTELVPRGGSSSFIVNIPVPETAYPGTYVAKIRVLDNNNHTVATGTFGLKLKEILVQPILDNASFQIGRRGIVFKLVFHNPEQRDAVFLARLVLVKGQGNCVNVTACAIYDYAETITIPPAGSRVATIEANLDNVNLTPLDVLDARLLIYDETGSYLINQYRIARIPVLELLRHTISLTVTPSQIEAAPGSQLNIRLDISSSIKVSQVRLDTLTDNPALVKTIVPSSSFTLNPGEISTEWITLRLSPTASPGSEATVYILLKLGNTTLATAPVKIRIPYVRLDVRLVERYKDQAVVEVGVANLGATPLHNIILGISFSENVEVVESDPGTHTISMAVARFSTIAPGDTATMKVKLLVHSSSINYTVLLQAVPEGSYTSFTLVKKTGEISLATIPTSTAMKKYQTTTKTHVTTKETTTTTTKTIRKHSPTTTPVTSAAKPEKTGQSNRYKIVAAAAISIAAAIAIILLVKKLKHMPSRGGEEGTALQIIWM